MSGLHKKRLRKKKFLDLNKIAIIGAIFICLTVGFAALLTTLDISGVVTVKVCQPGTYSTLFSTTCTACPDGYTSEANAKSESECFINTEAGTYIATEKRYSSKLCSW